MMKRGKRKDRGATLMVTLIVTAVLVGVVLVLGEAVRVENVTVNNRVGRMTAHAAERGAEQWVLSLVDLEASSPGTLASMENSGAFSGRMIGDCAVWLIKPDPEVADTLAFGLQDEGGKIDLNTATPDMLLKLPGMAQEIVDAIVDWRDADSNTTGVGAEDDFYLSAGNHPEFPEEYRAKNSDFESVDELRLVRWVDDAILFGGDLNHNGALDDSAGIATGAEQAFNDGRGIYPFVTAWGVKATVAAATTTTQGGTGGTASPVDLNSSSTTQLRRLLEANVPEKSDAILTLTRQLRPFTNSFDWYFKVGLTQEEFSKMFTQLTANPPVAAGPATQPAAIAARLAKVNVYTAPREVLYCLPGLEESDADAIVGSRDAQSSSTPADLSWLIGVLTPEKLTQMGGYVTGASKVYSADIVAASSDGRAFKRVRIVVDARTAPSKIIYRRDMTSAGWPLDASVLTSLKEGRGYGNLSALTQSNMQE
jgi:DNA uptake protein ComE-like DNA-binding protein